MNKLDDYTYETLEELNEDLYNTNLKFECFLIGGTLASYYLGNEFRKTLDIDILENSPIPTHLLMKHGVDVVHVTEVPPKEELEIEEKIKFSNLDVLIPKIEMLVTFKLMTTRGKDFQDLRNYPLLDNCNIEKLRNMINEYSSFLVSPDNPDLNYKQLEELLKHRNLI